MENHSALIVIDIQKDFCPGGSLAIPEGDSIVPAVNGYIQRFMEAGAAVFVSRDWHPPQTTHFKDQGGLWPAHCVQGSVGAEFHRDLNVSGVDGIASKGQGCDSDDYSATQAVLVDGAPLPLRLRQMGVKRVYLVGLATDYCVKESAIEFKVQDFDVTVLLDGCMGLSETQVSAAIEEMRSRGVNVIPTLP